MERTRFLHVYYMHYGCPSANMNVIYLNNYLYCIRYSVGDIFGKYLSFSHEGTKGSGIIHLWSYWNTPAPNNSLNRERNPYWWYNISKDFRLVVHSFTVYQLTKDLLQEIFIQIISHRFIHNIEGMHEGYLWFYQYITHLYSQYNTLIQTLKQWKIVHYEKNALLVGPLLYIFLRWLG